MRVQKDKNNTIKSGSFQIQMISYNFKMFPSILFQGYQSSENFVTCLVKEDNIFFIKLFNFPTPRATGLKFNQDS